VLLANYSLSVSCLIYVCRIELRQNNQAPYQLLVPIKYVYPLCKSNCRFNCKSIYLHLLLFVRDNKKDFVCVFVLLFLMNLVNKDA